MRYFLNENLDASQKLIDDEKAEEYRKTIFKELKGEINPMKTFTFQKRNLPIHLFDATQTAKDISMSSPKEVILPEYLL